jgi:tetratricopeptide (TPR) repeat protein
MLVLQFMPVGSAIMADRYSYLSAVGLFFILAWYLDLLFTKKDKIFLSMRWILIGVFLIYIGFLYQIAFDQTMVWKNSETLWTDVISKYPQADVSYKNRGNYYGNLNLTDKALNDYMVFLRIKQNDAGVYSNVGNIYGIRGETGKALEAYSKSIALDSLNPQTYLNRAITYAKAKQFSPAVQDYNQAIMLDPGMVEIYANRAYTYLEMGRLDDAIRDFSFLIRNYPRNDNYFLNRGLCYYQMKQFPESLADFEQSIALNPANGLAYFNISVIYNELKDYRKAYQYALKASSMNFQIDKNFLATLKMKAG